MFGLPLTQTVSHKHGLPIIVLHTINWFSTYKRTLLYTRFCLLTYIHHFIFSLFYFILAPSSDFISLERFKSEERTVEETEFQRLLKTYEAQPRGNICPLTPDTPPTVVGRILMMYLESLPDPLIPREYYHTYTRVIRNQVLLFTEHVYSFPLFFQQK